jgi:hypothetical protein
VYQAAGAAATLAAIQLERADFAAVDPVLSMAERANESLRESAIVAVTTVLRARAALAAGEPDLARSLVTDVRRDPRVGTDAPVLRGLLGWWRLGRARPAFERDVTRRRWRSCSGRAAVWPLVRRRRRFGTCGRRRRRCRSGTSAACESGCI